MISNDFQFGDIEETFNVSESRPSHHNVKYIQFSSNHTEISNWIIYFPYHQRFAIYNDATLNNHLESN